MELPEDGAVVVQGICARLAAPPDGLTGQLVAGQLVAAFAKYARPPRGYVVDPANWSSPDGGIWAVTPRIVFG